MARFDPSSPHLFIDHDYLPASGPARAVQNPATLETVGWIARADEHDCQRAVQRVSAAQRDWARLDSKTRASLLHQLAQRIESSDPGPVAELMTLEMGKPYPEALGELANVASVFRYYAELARDEAGKVAGSTQQGSFQYARYEPYGVSVHIMPYNYPILLFAWTAAASLAAGNGVIVKPAEFTSLCTLAFMEHFRVLPAGLVACVTGEAATGEYLVRSPDTHVVAFTGSVATGRRVAVACAEQLKPCLIESGGNDALIVTDSAPLEVAVAGSVTAAFHLSGQICTSAERFYVTEGIHDRFVAAFTAATRRLRIGPGLGRSEIGPLVSEAARRKTMEMVEAAVTDGAQVACGGRVPPGYNTGWFYEPTILTEVRPGMRVLQEEVFGPVAAICRVRDLDEALELANRSRYGLGASIFTTRLDEAHRAAEALQTGMVWVNNPLIDNDALPFGGWKLSGLGRELGRQGLEAFRQSKMVVIDHQPTVQDWWYPYDDSVFHPGAE